MQYLIRSGTVVDDKSSYEADIYIEDGAIAMIGKDLHQSNTEVIDASGMLILPGGVDPHTHFDLPMFGTVSSDDHYTGHKAAAFGGTTTVMDFVPQSADSLQEGIDEWHHKADAKAAIDFGFHMNITQYSDEIAGMIPKLIGAGISSIKVFTAYNDKLRLADANIFRVMRIAEQHGILTMLHAENGDINELLVSEAIEQGNLTPEWHALTRPAWGAVESVVKACSFSAQTGAALYLVHMNTAGGVDQLEYARQAGVRVMGETCPQYLFFTIDHLRRDDGAKWVCSPPMRTQADNHRLWESLETGLMQVVGTDHCPFFYDGTQAITYEGKEIKIAGKELGKNDFTKIPNGLPGVGDRLPVLWTKGVGSGRITANQFVAMTSTNPAKIFGLYPRKGAIAVGSDADLVIWDTDRHVKYGVGVAQHRTDYNLYEGWYLKGYPQKVFLRGNLIVDGDTWLGKPGMGTYLFREPITMVL